MSSFNWETLVDAVVDGRFRLRTLTYAGKSQAEFDAVCAGAEGASSNVTLLALEPDEIDQVEAEMAAAAALQHPHLLRILGAGRYRAGGAELLYLASEAPDETLAARIEAAPLGEAAAERVLSHVIAGLEYLHGRGLIYRNLSPQTIVRAGSTWKLADYGGMAREGQPADLTPYLNGSAYTPPEAYDGRLTTAWDMWSFGTLTTEILTGSTSPFLLPARFEEIRRRCNAKDPMARASSAEIAEMLPRPVVKAPPAAAAGAAPAAATAASRPAVTAAQPGDDGTVQPPEAPPRQPAGRKGIRETEVSASPLHAAFRFPKLNYRTVLWIPALIVLALVFFWERRQREVPVPAPKPAAGLAPRTAMIEERPSPMPRPGDDRRRQAAIEAAERARAEEARKATGAQNRTHELAKEAARGPARAVTGRADFAGDDMNGRRTASGERFNNNALTAASRAFPLGTRVRVTNLANKRSTVVRVNDRGSFRRGYVIRLTKRAARELEFAHTGSAQVKLEVVNGG